MGGRARFATLMAALGVLGVLVFAPTASADLTGLLSSGSCSAKDANGGTGPALPYTFCDDGVPAAAGGATPNVGALSAVAVPADYDGITGLPAKAADAATVPGADPSGNVALDVDVSLPDPVKFPTSGNTYPVVVLMHGCCSGDKTGWEAGSIDGGGNENWHYNNAWFASRGYIVVNYTARGFVNNAGHGSTGQTQLDSGRYEINDYQSLVGQLADKGDLDPGAGVVKVDPQRIVPTGGSYGGGFSWMALTDPTWDSPGASTPMKVAAAAPKFGWTNLVESLDPRGDDRRDALPETDPTTVKNLLKTEPGFPKRSIVSALFATGVNPSTSHTTFPQSILDAQICLNSFDPFASNPLCTSTLNTELGVFIDQRSAYFQQHFFDGLAAGTIDPVPVFSAGTFTDKLFPAPEHRRMVERLKQAVAPATYPVQEYYGDYNHFVQDKRKEWADVCGGDHHVCAYDDYPGHDLNADPSSRSLATGVTTRLNRFLDHYAQPPGDASAGQPDFDVTGALQVCPQDASFLGAKEDEPGPRFTAPSYAQLAPNSLTVDAPGAQATTNPAANPHGANDDPVGNLVTNGGKCPVESAPGGTSTAGAGVASYDSATLPRDYTMLGATRITVTHQATGPVNQLEAKLYDLYPDGDQVLVDRGMRRIVTPGASTTFDLHGAGWRFAAGHKLRVEVMQDDDTFIKSSVLPSSLLLSGVKVQVPVREASASLGGGSSPRPASSGSTGPAPVAALRAPRLASDQGPTRRFRLRVRLARGSPRAARFEVDGRDTRSRTARRLTSTLRGSLLRFRGKLGHTYRFRARAIGTSGAAGPWTKVAVTVVPLDAKRGSLRLRGRWARRHSSRAWGRGLARSSRRGARASLRVRGGRIYIVGRRTRHGGKARVRLNGRRRTITFRARRTQNRHVVAMLRGRRKGVNGLRITVLRGPVELDAIGPRRP